MSKKVVFGVIFSILSAFVVFTSQQNKINNTGAGLINQSFEESIALYATVRVLNGVISVAQGTQISPPGVTITIGEILDPINDLVERFSLLVLLSVASLGVQKILLGLFTADIFFYVLAGCVVVANITYWVSGSFRYGYIYKITAIVVFLNFSIPVMSISNDMVYNHFAKDHYDIKALNDKLHTSTTNMQSTNKRQPPPSKEQSFIAKLGSKIKDTISLKFYRQKMENYKQFAKDSTVYIIDLFIIFVFKTIVFPLIFLFLFYQVLVLRIERYNGQKDKYGQNSIYR